MVNKYVSIRCFLVAITIFFATIKSGQAISILDQQQPIYDTTAPFNYAIGGASEQQLAQVVTSGMSGFLTEVRFPLGARPLLVEIEGVAGGRPDGNVLTSEAFPVLFWPNTGFARIVFSTPIFFKAGDAFAIVLSSTGEGGLGPGPLGDPYSGGDAFFGSPPYPINWLPLTAGLSPPDYRFDLPFQTFVEPTPGIPEPATFILVGTGFLGLAGYGKKKFFKK